MKKGPPRDKAFGGPPMDKMQRPAEIKDVTDEKLQEEPDPKPGTVDEEAVRRAGGAWIPGDPH